MRKGEGLMIEDGGLPRLGGEELSSDRRFEADIINSCHGLARAGASRI